MTKPFYKTIAHDAHAELVEKKSRFIAAVRPVTTEEQALEFIAAMRSKYYDASHNVYAYIIGVNNIMRYSDDGEPSGTAGIPALEVLKKEELIDVAVVVTRYFGGTMLGAGGLIRAYGSSAKLGIDAGGIVVRTLCDVVHIKADYSLLGKIQYELLSADYIISEILYEAEITVIAHCKVEQTQAMIAMICDVTNARALCETVDCIYIDL